MSLKCGNGGCVVECHKRVYVKLQATPEVSCNAENLSADIPVELDINIKPKCHISEVKHHGSDKNCHHRCSFIVHIDADCEARVLASPCESQLGKVDLFFRAPVKTECVSGDGGHHGGHGLPLKGETPSSKDGAFFRLNKKGGKHLVR